MELTVSQYIAKVVKAHGSRSVFELSGGMIMHLLDAIAQEGGIEIVNVYHEQAAAFAADAEGRLSGRPGVAIGTSGPGAINLLTGVGSSFFDSSPTVFITGQVNRHEQKGGKDIRQLGFQETDIVSMAKPVTKFAARITEPEQIIDVLPRAFAIATSGRPGSVLVDVPMDVFRAKIDVPDSANMVVVQKKSAPDIDAKALENLVQSLKTAKRPLILAGAGIRAARCQIDLKNLAETLEIPVANSLLACDVLPYNHPLRVGMIGTYGHRWANIAISECDVLLVLGSRLDIRQTGADTVSFKQGRQIFHVDVEAGEINNRVKDCVAIKADLPDFFEAAQTHLGPAAKADRRPWIERINELRTTWPDIHELNNIAGINPNVFMHALSKGRNPAAYCVDVGLHQMWAAQSLEITQDARFLTSGGMGAMGFALPAGVASAFHFQKTRPIVVVAGDAGFQLNIQELQSIAHHHLPVKMIVINNHCHGMTRQFQDTYFASRYTGTVWGYSTPDFAAVARGYGLAARQVKTSADVAAAVEWLWADPLSPALLEVEIDLKTNAYPKMAFGKPISEMEPFAKPMEMEGT